MTEASSTEDVITLRIRFKSETLERFIERYGGDLGPDEVFVRTKEPLAVGSAIAFDFTLNDGSALINGRGKVSWARLQGDPTGSPGMGVRIQSLSAASWQNLRRVLAASGRSDASVGASLAARRSTPAGPPALSPLALEDLERTEVARMPPNFFDQAFDSGARSAERARLQMRQPTASFESAPTPQEGTPVLDARGAGTPSVGFEKLDFEDLEDIEIPLAADSDVDVDVGAEQARIISEQRKAFSERPSRVPAARTPEPWPRSLTPAASRIDGQGGLINAAVSVDVPAAWRSPTGRTGVEATAPFGAPSLAATAPMGQPALSQLVSSTASHVPPAPLAPNDDPDSVETPVARRTDAPSGPVPVRPAQAVPLSVASYPPPEKGGFANEFDVAPQSGSRSGSGRIGPAISPEEMALAAAAVRGPAGETPQWPGVAAEPPRTPTFKIWVALFLAASGVVGALLWLTPMLSRGRVAPPAVDPAVQSAPGTVAAPGAGPGEESPPSAPPAVAEPVPAPAAVAEAPPAPAAAPPAPPATPTPSPPPAAAAVPEDKPPVAPPPAASAPAVAAPAATAAAPAKPRPRLRKRRSAAEGGGEVAAAAPAAEAAAPDPTAANRPGPGAGVVPAVTGGAGTALSPGPAGESPAAAPAAAGIEVSTEDVYWLSVRSTPSGADVLIDGQSEGKTPFQRRIFDPARSYNLVVRKAGFSPIERTVSGSSDWARRGNVRTLAVTARLEPVPGAAVEEAPASAPVSPPVPPSRRNPFDEPVTPAPRP